MNHLADPAYRALLAAAAAVLGSVSPRNRRSGTSSDVYVNRERLRRLELAIDALPPGLMAQIEADGPAA